MLQDEFPDCSTLYGMGDETNHGDGEDLGCASSRLFPVLPRECAEETTSFFLTDDYHCD
jgi:hypothetical protein